MVENVERWNIGMLQFNQRCFDAIMLYLEENMSLTINENGAGAIQSVNVRRMIDALSNSESGGFSQEDLSYSLMKIDEYNFANFRFKQLPIESRDIVDITARGHAHLDFLHRPEITSTVADQMYDEFNNRIVERLIVTLSQEEELAYVRGYDETFGKINQFKELSMKYARALVLEYHRWLMDNFDIRKKRN